MKKKDHNAGLAAVGNDTSVADDSRQATPPPDGGFAFPVLEEYTKFNEHHGQYEDYYAPHGGMSMRDYFAGQVISQCHITVEKHAPEEADPMLVEAYAFRYARTAYAIADAMLVERAKFKRR